MREFLLAEDRAGDTVLHCAIFYGDLETFTLLWNFIKEVLSRTDQKTVWQKGPDQNIFIRSIQRVAEPETDAVEVIPAARETISAAQEILSPEEIRGALKEQSSRGSSLIIAAERFKLTELIFEPEKN